MLKKALKVKFQKDKKKQTVHVMPPNYEAEQAMRIAYAKAYKQSIQQGVATRPSMLELMRKEGVWTDENEDELTSLTVNAALLEAALLEQEDRAEQKKLVLELSKVRNKIYELVSIKTMPLEFTAEQMAEDVRLDYYISRCTYDENGTRYFKSHDDFLARRHESDAEKIFSAVVDEMSKSNIDMLRQLPEHQWLIDNKFMDKEGNLLDGAFEQELAAAVEADSDIAEMAKKE